jgi:3-methyladenine DNA glycosylase AlkD
VKTREARALGKQIAKTLQAGGPAPAYALLAPVLTARTPFHLLDLIGEAVGARPAPAVNDLLEEIAARKTEGGWVVIASALRQRLECDPADAFARCRAYIVAADVWYGADIPGERVPGPALVDHFDVALPLLAPWRADENRWVRRAVGVAVHFWAKRSRGAPEQAGRAQALLNFLTPLFEEWEMDAAKGVGWGLKTLGRYYPECVTGWLAEQIVQRQCRHRAVIRRKALTYLSDAQRARLTGE